MLSWHWIHFLSLLCYSDPWSEIVSLWGIALIFQRLGYQSMQMSIQYHHETITSILKDFLSPEHWVCKMLHWERACLPKWWVLPWGSHAVIVSSLSSCVSSQYAWLCSSSTVSGVPEHSLVLHLPPGVSLVALSLECLLVTWFYWWNRVDLSFKAQLAVGASP